LIVRDKLLEHNVPEKKATEWAHKIAAEFGSVSRKELESEEIVILGPEELEAVDALVAKLATEDRGPEEAELKTLERPTTALDVAMFGRMRADAKDVNVDASVQVAHAITTNQVRVEADYWTAVDDLNTASDSGAGGIGEREFGSGVYYVYACVDVPALVANLGGDSDLARRGIDALVRSAATIGPGGHRNSFANRVYAQYLRVEIGDQQPRTLAAAFEKAITPRDGGLTEASIDAIEGQAEALNRAYGQLYSEAATLDVPGKRGSIDEVLTTADKSVA
jgi:CRISPR system Cascade subunit CasC